MSNTTNLSFDVDRFLNVPLSKDENLGLILDLVEVPLKTDIRKSPSHQQEIILKLEKIVKLQEILKRATRKYVKTFVDFSTPNNQTLTRKYHNIYTEKYHH